MECSKNSPTREVYSDIDLPQKTEKNSNKQPNLPLKGIRKQSKPKVSRRKEIIKIREETKENNNNRCSIKRLMKPRLFFKF